MSFDILAPLYRPLEVVLAGGVMQHCRTAFLDRLPLVPRRALLCGEGPGRFLLAVLKQHPDLEVLVLEQSQPMIKVARTQLARHAPASANRVEFMVGDICHWQGEPGGFDLVVTHFFLDCFRPDQLETIVPQLAAALSSQGVWILSDFTVPPYGWRRRRAELILWLMYRFFRLVTRLPASRLADPAPYLKACGLQRQYSQFFNLGLLRSELWLKTGSPKSLSD